MSRVYLGLGSNLGDRYANLQRAVDELRQFVTVTAVSSVYSTEPWGDIDQPAFLNICVAAISSLPPHELLADIKKVERELGRTPTRHWGPRLIDIDILFYDDLVLSDETLTVPHPFIADRSFVLVPLADIIPDFRHPQTGLSVQEMLDKVDSSGVERLFEMPFPGEALPTDASPA